MGLLEIGLQYVENIRRSGMSIYDIIDVGDPSFWVPSPELEAVLNHALDGLDLSDLALRTRSKVLKVAVCEALGYPVPKSFSKTQPRFPGQNFDTYGQQANNLQVWNEELSPTRRYVVVQILPDGLVGRTRVVSGDTLALLDTTGTLTQKYQARLAVPSVDAELISQTDTERVLPSINDEFHPSQLGRSPIEAPRHHELLSIGQLFERLRGVIGSSFPDRGIVQERNRGADLHRIVCDALGYADYADNGQFPDIRNQMLEVKLQTSPTIDLGLVSPDSDSLLDMPQVNTFHMRHRDVRYAVFMGTTDGVNVTLQNLFVVIGDEFFNRFQRFEGKVLNKKLQIPLPSDFFN